MNFFRNSRTALGFIRANIFLSFNFLCRFTSAQETGSGGIIPTPTSDARTQDIVFGILVGLAALSCLIYAFRNCHGNDLNQNREVDRGQALLSVVSNSPPPV